MSDDILKRIEEIKERLSKTTKGKWKTSGLPYDYDCGDDACVLTDNDMYICATVVDNLCLTEKHNVDEDTIFIANAKEDIQFLLNLIDKYNQRGEY